MESLKIFDYFKFSDLNEDWIQSVWDTEFMMYNEPPDEYLMFLESEDMRLLLHETCIVVKAWLEDGTDQNNIDNCSEISWNTLIIMDIKVRALLAILGYIIKKGQSKVADVESRESCLYATSLYFVLLAIPGSNAFNVFHPNLYQQAIETLRISSDLLQPPIKKRNKAVNLDDLNMMDESVNESIILSSNEKETLVQNLNTIICNLIIMIKSFWFKDHMHSLDITIYGLLEVTKMEDDCMVSHCFNKQASTLEGSLPQNAYVALQELCDNKHGPVKVTVTFIAKYILPRLLYGPMDTQAKFITNIREHTINFLKNLLYVYEKEAKTAILTLVQHLMLKCPDRLEARQKQASVLVKLLGICKQNIALEAFKDLILLSHHSKIPLRLFAQEIIGKLLFESYFANCNITDSIKIRVNRVLFAIVLSRCMDCSSMVRGKAMAIIADFTDSNNEIDKAIFQTIFEKSDPTKNFPTFSDMKDALSEDIDLLPGLNTLITMLTERMEDERAMVRRSTLLILKNLTVTFPSLIHKVLPVIKHRCRDPTLLVRRFAVQVLSQLLQQFPDNSLLLDEWVEAVVPQIFDVEIKVQEKVLEYLQELLLNKIRNVSMSTDSTASDLPWKILNTITNLKMRKHLSKACSLWVKSGIVTNTVIKNVQSHIGTNNNIEAWVLLVALAENTNLPNMDKYFLNYKEIFAENNFCTSLVLQVLRYSWKSLDPEILEHLHLYLYKCLQQFQINYGLISICLDIIHNIIHYLNPDKNKVLESNMLNLIKISETEIAKIFKSETDALEAAPNYLKAMFTLGYATLLCAYKISPLILRIIQGFLLEWEALPEIIKEIDELQPSAIVILGQQAMRDREVAKEVVPILGKLMRQKTNINSIAQIAVKINAAKALADICIRFTALVEPYLSDMCVSMKDSSSKVRETIMVIFIQLLLEDYIKMKGPFFFHLLTMLSDSDSMIRELTIFLIEERLLTKNKTLISQQFLQSIYHYNNYQSQHKICHHRMRENEVKALTLPGKVNENKRRAIYDFMLDHLDPPGKIKLLVKVTSQILGGTCVDAIDIKKEEGAHVLRDALYIISNDRLRPSSFNRHIDDDQQEYEEQSNAHTLSPASNAITIIIEGIKKHGLEVLLPVLIKLRIKLSGLKSPVENDVKKILVKTYSEYNKDQLLNILSEYPKLEKEVEQFKKQLGETRLDDNENFSDEENNSPSGSSNNQNISFKSSDILSPIFQPTVVVKRILLSQLPSRRRSIEANSISPTSILDGWSSPVSSTPISDPQPGPSTSTPNPYCDFDSNNTVGAYATRARRFSTFFQNEKELSSLQYNKKRKNIFQVQEDSESD